MPTALPSQAVSVQESASGEGSSVTADHENVSETAQGSDAQAVKGNSAEVGSSQTPTLRSSRNGKTARTNCMNQVGYFWSALHLTFVHCISANHGECSTAKRGYSEGKTSNIIMKTSVQIHKVLLNTEVIDLYWS